MLDRHGGSVAALSPHPLGLFQLVPQRMRDRFQKVQKPMLHEFITVHRDEIIRRCRVKVAMRSIPPPTEAEINHGVPVFLEQLAEALRVGQTSSPEIARSAIQHGHDLLLQGFTVSQVVHDYGDVCQVITELALETNAPVSTDDFRVLNRCLDDAIAGAVTEYGRAGNLVTLDRGTAHESQLVGFLAHEMRNLLSPALLAFEVLRRGNVGIGGSTGTVLHRSLMRMRALIGRSLAEIRLTDGVAHPEALQMSGFIGELVPAATLEADARGIGFSVMPIDDRVAVEADRDVLAAMVGNLLQNAFKFTRPRSAVTLSVSASPERVLIEVEDECGGLPDGNVNDLFRPFEQRSADRTGLGLGLAFCRWGADASQGRLYARSLPARGCVFTIDLPRIEVPARAG